MILDEIIQSTRVEMAKKKSVLPLEKLQVLAQSRTDGIRDFGQALASTTPMALIAEIKRASPSAGVINANVDVVEQAQKYVRAGAAALSVVTNKVFFNGDDGFLQIIRALVEIPLLRKDFIVDLYQIYESKYLGADAILLIARLFSAPELTQLVLLTHELGLQCMVETHDEADIAKALVSGATIIGINVRDLDTFTLDTPRALALAPLLPPGKILVAESGIHTRADVETWRAVGAKAVLVGTTLMQAKNVEEKIKELLQT